MSKRFWIRCGSGFAVAMLLVTSAGWLPAQATDQEQPEIKTEPQAETKQKPEAAPRPTVRQRRDVRNRRFPFSFDYRRSLIDEPQNVGKYWIGVHCSPAGPDLRAQLNLPEGQGLVVDDVLPNSPAEKAGLKRFDVLLNVGDRRLANVADLFDAVQATENKEMAIPIYRGGKEMTIQITPAQRPRADTPQPYLLRRDRNRADWWLNRLEEGVGGRGFNLRYFRPGIVLEFPDDLKLTITKKGKEPANIVVEKGDGKWEVTEEKLGELPENVRPHVEAFLGRSATRGSLRLRYDPPVTPLQPLRPAPYRVLPSSPYRTLPPREVAPRVPLRDRSHRGQQRIERRLDETMRQIEELRQLVDELRKGQSNKKPADSNSK